jgi:hypothetical protein
VTDVPSCERTSYSCVWASGLDADRERAMRLAMRRIFSCKHVVLNVDVSFCAYRIYIIIERQKTCQRIATYHARMSDEQLGARPEAN